MTMDGHGAHAVIETIAAIVLVVSGAIVLVLAALQRRQVPALARAGRPALGDAAMARQGDQRAISLPVAMVVALSLGAAAIHLAAGPSHVEELGDLGLGFYWAALFQFAWALAYAMRGSPRVAWVGIVGNLAISAAWVWSRTVGLPVGPDAWHPEAIGVPDAMATLFQVVLAGVLAFRVGSVRLGSVASARRQSRRLRSSSFGLVAVVPMVGIVFLATTLAVATAGAGHDHGVSVEHAATHVAGADSP